MINHDARQQRESVSESREALRQLIYGYQRTQLVAIAAKLGLPDLLAAGPLLLHEIATQTTVPEAVLERMLNGLVSYGVCAQDDDGRYRLTPVGDGLRADVPGSLATLAVLSGEEYYRAWLGFEGFLADGKTPFAHAHGAPLFDWYQAHPAFGDRFHRRMAARVAAFAPGVAAAVDLATARLIVDIGGGVGILLAAFLDRWPRARGILFDLPAAAATAAERIATAGLSERVEIVSGDFFLEVPAGGDVYVLCQILHDWDDAQCRAILGNIRSAVQPEGRLLIAEMLMPERVNGPSAVVDLDLLMMALTGGRERSVSAFRVLLERAGWTLAGVHEAGTPGGLSVLVALPA